MKAETLIQALVVQIVSELPHKDVAEAAADGKAVCDTFTCIVRDEVMRDITVGHALVVVAYGSELSCNRVKQAILATSSLS